MKNAFKFGQRVIIDNTREGQIVQYCGEHSGIWEVLMEGRYVKIPHSHIRPDLGYSAKPKHIF